MEKRTGTVIFSITFGPDEKGVVRQNFGPINKDGGGKRLNVIGILNPYDTTRYLLGIMLDGDTYRMTENTKDREIAQKNLLEKFRGWKIFRIWAMDWWLDRDFVIEQLLAKLEKLKAASAEKAAHDQPAQEEVSSDNTQLDAELERQSEEVSEELKAEEERADSEVSGTEAAAHTQKEIPEPQPVPESKSERKTVVTDKEHDGEPEDGWDHQPDQESVFKPEQESKPSVETKSADDQKPDPVTGEPGKNTMSNQSAEKTVSAPDVDIDNSQWHLNPDMKQKHPYRSRNRNRFLCLNLRIIRNL